MLREIKESDWKALRRLHPIALERFCERVLTEIGRVHEDSTRSFHQRYLDIYDILRRRDHQMGRIFNDPKRSNALIMLAQMRAEGLLTDEECSRLSPETRDVLDRLSGKSTPT